MMFMTVVVIMSMVMLVSFLTRLKLAAYRITELFDCSFEDIF